MRVETTIGMAGLMKIELESPWCIKYAFIEVFNIIPNKYLSSKMFLEMILECVFSLCAWILIMKCMN